MAGSWWSWRKPRRVDSSFYKQPLFPPSHNAGLWWTLHENKNVKTGAIQTKQKILWYTTKFTHKSKLYSLKTIQLLLAEAGWLVKWIYFDYAAFQGLLCRPAEPHRADFCIKALLYSSHSRSLWKWQSIINLISGTLVVNEHRKPAKLSPNTASR